VLVLDTDILSIVQREEGAEYDTLIARLKAANDAVHVTIVSIEEQMRGWLGFIAKRRDPDDLAVAYAKLHRLVRDFSHRPILAFDDAAATVLTRLRRSRIRIGEMDLRIAAIVISREAILITRNISHFSQIPGLIAEDWIRNDSAGK
jgi:tRNA(fMet)-specific endonuclease VapC